MKKELTPGELGEQLRCPSGKHAQEVGETMFLSNRNMIFATIDLLHLRPESTVFEIGFGNASHLWYLFNTAEGLYYRGVETSGEMVGEATRNHIEEVENGDAVFYQVDGTGRLEELTESCDYCFTVNTIYFWTDPQYHLNEMYRILSPGGTLAVTFIEKEFGSGLAFTQQGFSFYLPEEVTTYMEKSGFNTIEVSLQEEETLSKDGQQVKRSYWIITARK